jgi:hypothetical protein
MQPFLRDSADFADKQPPDLVPWPSDVVDRHPNASYTFSGESGGSQG